MKTSALKTTAKKYMPLYLPVIAITVWMRYLCHIDDSNMLIWILKPTVRWVSILSGISFEYIAHSGYVNHFHQFLVAPACSGLRFLLLTFLMLVFSFLRPGSYLMKESSGYKRYLWIGFSFFFAYFSTIFANGIRIAVSICLPTVLTDFGLLKGWLTPDRLHTIIGSITYLSFLYFVYPAADFIYQHVFMRTNKNGRHATQCPDSFIPRTMTPVFWYLLIVLAVPFLGRLYRNEWNGFAQYTTLILCVCLAIILLQQLIHILHKHFS